MHSFYRKLCGTTSSGADRQLRLLAAEPILKREVPESTSTGSTDEKRRCAGIAYGGQPTQLSRGFVLTGDPFVAYHRYRELAVKNRWVPVSTKGQRLHNRCVTSEAPAPELRYYARYSKAFRGFDALLSIRLEVPVRDLESREFAAEPPRLHLNALAANEIDEQRSTELAVPTSTKEFLVDPLCADFRGVPLR